MSADNEPIFSAPTPGPLLKLIVSFAVTIYRKNSDNMYREPSHRPLSLGPSRLAASVC